MRSERLIDETIRREGAKFTNIGGDRGGPTKYGITQKTLSGYRKCPCSPADVAALTEAEARLIYRKLYIEEPGFSKIANEFLQELVVDCGINHGTGRASKWLQEAAVVKQDGNVGAGTILAVNSANPKLIFAKLLCTRFRFYEDLDDFDPSQEKFEDGWTNRACEFVMLLAEM